MTQAGAREALIADLARIDTATVSNAMDALISQQNAGSYSFSSLELRCLLPELPPMVGYAVTCTREYGIGASGRVKSKDRALYEAVNASPKPVVVVCQYVGPERLLSNQFGDIMITTFQRLGAVGAVTDGGYRDLAGIQVRAPGFQVFAAGAVAAAGVSIIADVGDSVSVSGLTVRPGDLLHGDANGIVTIPDALVGLIGKKSAEILEREEQKVAFIKSADFTLEELAKRSAW